MLVRERKKYVPSQTRRSDFDNTMMNTYCTCPRKYDFRHNRGLVSHRESNAPQFGKAIHSALDLLYKDWDADKAIEVFRAEYQEDPEDDKRTYAVGEWILRNYAEKYKDQPWKILATKRACCIPLPNGNNFIGRIDKIIDWNGVLWVVDHKTTSMLGPQYTKMAEPNAQFTGYTWAARQLGYKVSGLILDAILVAKGLLESKYRDKLTPLLRWDTYRTDSQIEEWANLANKTQKSIEMCEENKEWLPIGQLTGACTYYGECSFRKLCVEDADLRERLIKTEYRVDHWDPRDKEEVG